MTKKKLYSEFIRFGLNLWPCLRRTGGRVTYLAEDFTRLSVKLSLNWKTRNVVGTIFGGSMYSSTDPYFMLMLMKILGDDYVVWDKGCTIRFKRPAKETIFADFIVTPEMIHSVRSQVANNKEYDFTWAIQYKDKNGIVYAEFDKVIYVAQKSFYKDKLKRRSEKPKL
jgi:acyl-coenzyme A thioesterase PaaI-like protein